MKALLLLSCSLIAIHMASSGAQADSRASTTAESAQSAATTESANADSASINPIRQLKEKFTALHHALPQASTDLETSFREDRGDRFCKDFASLKEQAKELSTLAQNLDTTSLSPELRDELDYLATGFYIVYSFCQPAAGALYKDYDDADRSLKSVIAFSVQLASSLSVVR